MQSKNTLNQSIIDITNRIYLDYPELTKYIREIPSINLDVKDEKISNQNLLDYYDSLNDIVTQYSRTHLEKAKNNQVLQNEVIEYPYYGESEDIYTQSKEEQDIDPENSSKNKSKNENLNRHPISFHHNLYGSDLDVPGSELDDADERLGNEDEENNYYSLGGDDHNDLEEDNGEK
jgi:hypothetical protein